MPTSRIDVMKGGTTVMDHEPLQPIEQRHYRLTPEQEAHAGREIEHVLNTLSEQEPFVSNSAARVIAACLHTGPGSVLEHFAATNHLNPSAALSEVRDAIERRDHTIWAIALASYLEGMHESRPDVRTPDYQEPSPEIFLRSSETDRGEWVQLDGTPQMLEERLQKFRPDWGPPGGSLLLIDRDDWSIGNVVGFHGIDLSQVRSLRTLLRLAQGINGYGEAFASYLAVFGLSGAARLQYERLHLGSFENITEVVETYAYAFGLLEADTAPGEDRVRGPTVNPRLLERGLSEHYLWHQGRTKLHLFARETGQYDRWAKNTCRTN